MKIFKYIISLIKLPLHILEMVITYLPGQLGFSLRYHFWKKKLKRLGKNTRIDIGVYFQNPQYISIDDNCWIDRNVIILAGPPGKKRTTYFIKNDDFKLPFGEVSIGKNTHIAPNCVLSGIGGIYIGRNCGIASNSSVYSFSHHYRNLENRNDKMQYSFTPLARMDQQSMVLGPVLIEDYCAIGLNSVVLPGTHLNKGCWLSSGAVIQGTHLEQTLLYKNKSMQSKKINLSIKK
jgi:acetyltransferase-like isoleucine patch superfamily enzyme